MPDSLDPGTLSSAATTVEVPAVLLLSLLDPSPCQFDHHGGCQGHGFINLAPGEECPQAELRRRLREAGLG